MIFQHGKLKMPDFQHPDSIIESGIIKFFEYHCFESESSCDAKIWHHTHQRCTVNSCVNSENSLPRFLDRAEDGCPLVYSVTFEDGFNCHAFEDELFDSPDDFFF